MAWIGIDLGTSKTALAVLREGEARVVVNHEGASTTPSIVARTEEGRWLCGQAAKRLAVSRPQSTCWDFLRLLGKRFDSPESRAVSGLAPFEVVEGRDGYARVKFRDRDYHPAFLVALQLAKLRLEAEMVLDAEIDGAVIAVPASFEVPQEQLVRTAAGLAGLAGVHVSPSTALAALAPRSSDTPGRFQAICDVGGGSFTIVIVDSQATPMAVRAIEWEPFLGGEDFDQLLIRFFLETLESEERLDASWDPVVLSHLKETAETAKRRVSLRSEVEVEVPLGESRLWTAKLTRGDFELLLAPQLEWLPAPCEKALRDAGLKKEEIGAVLTVGGSSRIPKVLDTLTNVFGKEPLITLHPDEATALGAAVFAGYLAGSVPGGISLATRYHIGVEAPPGRFASILARQTSLPARATRLFHTADSRLELNILQGNSERAEEDVFLGRLLWEVPMRRGQTRLQVSVDVDVSGRTTVSTTDLATGVERDVPLRFGGSLSGDERDWYRDEVERYRMHLRTSLSKESQPRINRGDA